jgi:hypothetical protein
VDKIVLYCVVVNIINYMHQEFVHHYVEWGITDFSDNAIFFSQGCFRQTDHNTTSTTHSTLCLPYFC